MPEAAAEHGADWAFQQGALGVLCLVVLALFTVYWRWSTKQIEKRDKLIEEAHQKLQAKAEACRVEISDLHTLYRTEAAAKEIEHARRIEEKNDAQRDRDRAWQVRVDDANKVVYDAQVRHDRALQDLYERRLMDKDATIKAYTDLAEQVAVSLTASSAAQTAMLTASAETRTALRSVEDELRRQR